MLKIKCIENNDSGRKVYSGFITFKELSDYAFLKPLTVNRITDKSRIKGMKEYIEKEGSNYPPIVVAIEEGCKCTYSNSELRISKADIKEKKKRLVIIDGQHRYLSLKRLVEEAKNEEVNNKRQAIYILSGLSEFEQRQCFIEINDKMKRVSNISKKIFDSTQENYITLKTIIDLDIATKINIKNDQCTKKYPYKFILEANKIFFSNIEICNNEKYIEELNKYASKSNVIWRNILEFIEKNTNICIFKEENDKEHEYKSVKTEIFLIEFVESLIREYDGFKSIIEQDDDKIQSDIKQHIEKINTVYKYFSYEEDINKLSKDDKRDKIKLILGGSNND